MDTGTKPHAIAHFLPHPFAQPGTYLYPDGCWVRRNGDGTTTLIHWTGPKPVHDYSDFATHPDTATTSDTAT